MAAVDEISRMKVWNLYVVPKLAKVIQKMRDSNRRYAYIEYEFFKDSVGKIKILGKKSALKKRFVIRSPERGSEMYYNCIKDIKIDENTFIFVMFLYSQFYVFSPTLYRINATNKECYRPFKLTYDFPYQVNIWFREEILRDMFNKISKELIWFKIKQLQEDETLILEKNAAHNDIYFHKMYLEEYIEHLKIVLVHQDIINRIINLVKSCKRFLIFYIDHYLTYFFLFVTYDVEKTTFG